MRFIRVALSLCWLPAVTALVGCGASAAGGGPALRGHPVVMPGLVMPATGWLELDEHGLPGERGLWLCGRNDGLMGSASSGAARLEEMVEIRSRAHLWTLNGRPRESSRTTTTTIRRSRPH